MSARQSRRLLAELAEFERALAARARRFSARADEHGDDDDDDGSGSGSGSRDGRRERDDNPDDNELLDPIERAGPVSDSDLTRWEAVLTGVPGTAYESGRWLLSIDIPPTYPTAAPKIRFVTPVCHANVHPRTGEICLDLLRDGSSSAAAGGAAAGWSGACSVTLALVAVHQLLAEPDVSSPLNVDLAGLIRAGDLVAADGLVRYCTGRDVYRGE